MRNVVVVASTCVASIHQLAASSRTAQKCRYAVLLICSDTFVSVCGVRYAFSGGGLRAPLCRLYSMAVSEEIAGRPGSGASIVIYGAVFTCSVLFLRDDICLVNIVRLSAEPDGLPL